jgi:uncharacterized peroxidase-related enzyme
MQFTLTRKDPMPRISPLDPTTATGETAAQLEIARKIFGGIPNLVATAARAPAAVTAMLSLFGDLAKSSLGARTGELIAIAVAQANRCGYCLSAHTAVGGMHGLPPAELAAARQARSTDAKAAAILALAVAINAARGHIDDAALAAARTAGLTDAEIVEVVAHVALNVFTNYLNSVAETTIDFPVVPLADAA